MGLSKSAGRKESTGLTGRDGRSGSAGATISVEGDASATDSNEAADGSRSATFFPMNSRSISAARRSPLAIQAGCDLI